MRRGTDQLGEDDVLHAFRNPVRRYDPAPGDERASSPLVALRVAAARRTEADRAVLAAIADARDHHVSWAAIGASLGTGEAARQRYGRLVKR